MLKVPRESIDFYSTLMAIIETADAPEVVLHIRHEWRSLCETYKNLPALWNLNERTAEEQAALECAYSEVNQFCMRWKLYDVQSMIPTGLFVLLTKGETDLRCANFVVWDFTCAAPEKPTVSLPFLVSVFPEIESLEEFLRRVSVTLQLERHPELIHRLDELPVHPILVMEWDAEQQRFTPRPPDWVQKLRSEWGLDFAKYETLERIILALCKDYYSYVARHIGRCYTPPQVRMSNERPMTVDVKQRAELYYRETAWVHLLRRVAGWGWEQVLDFLMAQGVVERVPKLSDDYERALARLRKIPTRLRRMGM